MRTDEGVFKIAGTNGSFICKTKKKEEPALSNSDAMNRLFKYLNGTYDIVPLNPKDLIIEHFKKSYFPHENFFYKAENYIEFGKYYNTVHVINETREDETQNITVRYYCDHEVEKPRVLTVEEYTNKNVMVAFSTKYACNGNTYDSIDCYYD